MAATSKANPKRINLSSHKNTIAVQRERTAMKNIHKISKKLKKELGKEVKIETISDALLRRGFSLLYLNSEEGAEQLHHLHLTQYAQNKKCFTYCSSVKFVFIDDTLHKNDITQLLLHELAHIELRHIGYTDCHIYDEVSSEVEADAVVYNILNSRSKKYLITAVVVITILFLNTLGLYIIAKDRTASSDNAYEPPTVTEQQPDNNSDIVYVTPTGVRYHRKFCRYAQTENTIPLKIEEATKNHTPCKVCNP